MLTDAQGIVVATWFVHVAICLGLVLWDRSGE